MGEQAVSHSTLIVFAAMLIVVMGVRLRVSPRARLFIAKPPAAVFEALDIADGKVMDFGRVSISYRLLDAARQLFEFSYRTMLVGGHSRSSQAQFTIAERVPDARLVFKRAGLEGRSLNSELTEISYCMTAEGNGTRLEVVQHWGPRPLLAQLLARTDLIGGTYRLKGLIETGIPNERPFTLISLAVAVLTGLVTFATFSWGFGTKFAIFLTAALIVHEFGHLLAYRLIGQPWGRIMFLPFVGAVALPRFAFESQGQLVFSALMGPGFSAILGFLCLMPHLLGYDTPLAIANLGFSVAVLNVFNLLPIAPLDGGIAMRSLLGRMLGNHARVGLMALGVGLVGLGLHLSLFLIVLFGAFTIFANFRAKRIDHGLLQLPGFHVGITLFAYFAMMSAYVTFCVHFGPRADLFAKMTAT